MKTSFAAVLLGISLFTAICGLAAETNHLVTPTGRNTLFNGQAISRVGLYFAQQCGDRRTTFTVTNGGHSLHG